LQKPGIDAHPDPKRMLHAVVAPLDVQLGEAVLHVERHAHACLGVFRFSLALGIAEED